MAPKKMGRPPKQIKKNVNLGLRISEETAKELLNCSIALGISRTEVIERGIKLVASSVGKKET